MRILPLTLCAGLGLVGICAASGAAADCPRLATVKIASLPDGRVTIPVAVQNRPLSFLVDTGGIKTTIKWELARELGLPARQSLRKLTGTAGSMLNFVVTSEDFSIADLHVKDMPLYIESRPLPTADGTLGADILRHYELDIDFALENLSLLSQDQCAAADWTAAGYAVIEMGVTPGGHVRFPVKIDGTTVVATLDTGSAVSLINMKTAILLGIDPKTLTLIRNTGDVQIYAYPFQTLEIGRIPMKNPHLAIVSDNFLQGLGTDLVLGIDVLRRMRFTIAYGENRLYIAGAQ